MNSGDSTVGYQVRPESECPRDSDAFVCDRKVGCSGRHHDHSRRAFGRGTPYKREPLTGRSHFSLGRGEERSVELMLVSPGQHDRAGTRLAQQLSDDRSALLRRLSGCVHRLAHPLTKRPMVVDSGESEVHKWKPPQPQHGLVGCQGSAADVGQELAKGGLVHVAPLSCLLMDRIATSGTSPTAEAQARSKVAGSERPSIAFLGPAGTFTEEALFTQPDFADADVVPIPNLSEVLEAVSSGTTELAFVPVENSIEGTVNATMDSLVFGPALLIQREVVLDVHMHLLANHGTAIDSIRRVLSFPHAAAQCRRYLEERLPGVEVVPTNSTAEAARQLGEERRPHTAALAPRLAADLYGLAVLESTVEDHPDNQTRFVALAKSGIPAPTGHDKTSIVCFQREDRPGSLHGILSEFAARNINLTKLESRPTKRGLGNYCFLIDLEGHIADEVVADCLRVLHAELADVKFLGSYPAAGAHGPAVRAQANAAWKEAEEWVLSLRSQVRNTQ